jgi:hypothetical protein
VRLPFLKTNFMAIIEGEQAALDGLLINKSNGIYNRGVTFLDQMKGCPNSAD